MGQDSKHMGDALSADQWETMRRTAAEKIEKLRMRSGDTYYYGSWKSGSPVFADEIDKHHILHLLSGAAEKTGYEVVAFALLDDELDVILCGTAGTEKMPDSVMEEIRNDFNSYYSGKYRYSDRIGEHVGWSRIEEDHLTQACEQLHMKPVYEGYVREKADFWWSSANSYRGRYLWHFLNIWRVLAKNGKKREDGRDL